MKYSKYIRTTKTQEEIKDFLKDMIKAVNIKIDILTSAYKVIKDKTYKNNKLYVNLINKEFRTIYGFETYKSDYKDIPDHDYNCISLYYGDSYSITIDINAEYYSKLKELEKKYTYREEYKDLYGKGLGSYNTVTKESFKHIKDCINCKIYFNKDRDNTFQGLFTSYIKMEKEYINSLNDSINKASEYIKLINNISDNIKEFESLPNEYLLGSIL